MALDSIFRTKLTWNELKTEILDLKLYNSLEEDTEKTFLDMGLGSNFLYVIPIEKAKLNK